MDIYKIRYKIEKILSNAKIKTYNMQIKYNEREHYYEIVITIPRGEENG